MFDYKKLQKNRYQQGGPIKGKPMNLENELALKDDSSSFLKNAISSIDKKTNVAEGDTIMSKLTLIDDLKMTKTLKYKKKL